jgi:RND family efflux transporter MFP subunit
MRTSAPASWVVLVAVAAACRHAPEAEEDDKPAPAAVTCRPAAAATIDDLVDVTGVIAPPPKLDAVVSSPVPGRVAQVVVEEGDRVAAGALLAVVEDPALGAGSLEAKAAVENTKAQRTAADLEVARQDRLVASGIGARKDLEDARAKQAAAAADLATANARAGLAGAQLARREIRAPRAGVVLHLQRKVGESVDGTSATPIAEVADLTVLELHAQAPPAALRPLRDGMRATIQVFGTDAPISGTVVRVAPAVDPATRLGVVRIALASAEGIQVGTSATGRISIGQRQGVRVPASALRRSLVGEDEVVVCEGGTAHVRKVAIGSRGDQGVEIKDGLKADEQVVVDHVLGLQDEQPLTAPGKANAEKAGKAKAGDDKDDDDKDDDKKDDDKKDGDKKARAAKTTSPQDESNDKAGADKADKAGGNKASGDKPGADKADKAGGNKASGDKPGADKADKAGADKAGADKAGADKAGADKAGADKAGGDKPGAGKGGGEK